MKLSQTRVALLVLAVTVLITAPGCNLVNRIRAKNELNEAARNYRQGHFAEAEQHSKRAMELDPNQKTAPAFVARTIHAQYKPGVDTPENTAKAREAVEAYQKILARDPKNEEAYKAIAALYGALKQEDKQRQWIKDRAENNDADPKLRAEAYTVLASKDWDCSYKITELPTSKQTVNKDNKTFIVYKKPADKDFNDAKMCVTKGLEEINTAIKFDPNNESAWSFKTNLLLEAAKLAEMDGKMDEKARLAKEVDAAQKQTAELNKQNEQRKKEEEAKKSPSPPTT